MIRIKERNKDYEGYRAFTAYEFNGLNVATVNTIRRTILELVPTYSFQYFEDWHTSIKAYMNEEIKLRICELPVLCKNPKSTIEKSAIFELDANLGSFDKDVSLEDIKAAEEAELNDKKNNFTMVLNTKNTSKDRMYVTTEHASFFENGEPVPNPYKIPLVIVTLLPGEEIKGTVVSKLGIPLINKNYETAHVFYRQEAPDKFIMTIEVRNQLTEKELLERACDILLLKLEKLLPQLTEKIGKAGDIAKTRGEVLIDNEGHTLGNLITDRLQDHPNIKAAGYAIDHPLNKVVRISYATDGTSIVKIVTAVFDEIAKQLTKIKNSIPN